MSHAEKLAPAHTEPAAAPARPPQSLAGVAALAAHAAPALQPRMLLFGLAAGLQAKLAVGAPDDPAEREADAVAEQVLPAPAPQMRRTCACGGAAGPDGECAACKVKRLQRRSSTASTHSVAPPSVHATVNTPGRPLEPAVRSYMEPRFGADFSQVRVHTDPAAARSAQDVGALAYTAGSHLVFAPGQYRPQTEEGRRLIAHELAHTIQQRQGARAVQRDEAPAAPAGPSELEQLGISSRSFREAWAEFDRLRGVDDPGALALAPELLSRMGPDEAVAHGVDLALWLLGQGQRDLAERALQNVESGWWVRYIDRAGPDVPLTGGSPWGDPGADQLVARAEAEARAGRHEMAARLFSLAYMMSQMQLQAIRAREEAFAAEAGSRDLPVVGTILDVLWRSDAAAARARITRVLNFYPRLASESAVAGESEEARRLESLGQALATTLRDRYTLGRGAEVSLEQPEPAPSAPASPRPRASGAGATPTLASADVIFGDEEADIVTAVRDRVVEERPPFEGALVIQLPGNRYVHVRSERYAVTGTAARAHRWGRALFGTVNTVILATGARGGLVYYAAGLSENLSSSDLGVSYGDSQLAGGYGAFRGRILATIPDGYSVIAVLFRDGFSAPTPSHFYAFTSAIREDVAAGRADLPPEMVRTNVFGEIDRLMARGDDASRTRAAEMLARLNEVAFATVDWQTRFRYLEILLDAWTFLAEETAIVEIIKATRSRSELDAIFARIRQRAGLWDQLFNDLDHELWSMLVILGQRFGGVGPFSFDEFRQLLLETRLLTIVPGISIGPHGPEISVDALAEVEEAVLSALRMIEGLVDGIIALIAHPDRVIQGVGQLVKMVVMIKLADLGYPPAQQFVDQLFRQMARQVIFGLRGALVTGEAERFIRRIKWAIIWEVASMFVGVGEIRAAVEALGLTERAASLARFLGLVGRAGRLAEGEQVAARLGRLAGVLRRSSRALRSEEEALTLLSHLPEEDAARLARALERTEIDEGMTLARLAEADGELGEAAQRSLRQIEALQALATRAGGLSDELVAAFRRLARAQGGDIADIVRHVPNGHGERFARAISAIPADVPLGGRAASDMLRALAENPTRMNALAEMGYEAFSTIYSRIGRDPRLFDAYLESLGRLRARLTEQTRAVEFQELLDDLARGDSRAWSRLESEAAAGGVPRTRPLSAAELVEDEVARLGGNPETQELLRTNETLRRALLEHPYAARALRRCNTPCYPPTATPDEIARIDRLLRAASRNGEVDMELLTRYFHARRDRLSTAIRDLESVVTRADITGPSPVPGVASAERSLADRLNERLRFFESGREPTILPSRMDLAEAVRRAHDHGVRVGRQRAVREGLEDAGFVNPFEYQGGFGQGFDDIRVRGRDLFRDDIYIVEYKGGGATLDPGQMEWAWVEANIRRLREEGGDAGRRWARILDQAQREGRLKGVAYSSPFTGPTTRIGSWAY